MDSSQNSTLRGRGGKKHVWTCIEDAILIESLQELNQNTMWKADCGFKNGYLSQLETMLHAKLPGCEIKASPHIESRVKTLKKQYCALSEMLSKSGFCWNDAQMMLMCDKSFYDDWVKNHKEASGLYNKPFPHFHALAEIYGRDRATGLNVGNADDDEEEIRQEDASRANMESFFSDMNMEFPFDGIEDFESPYTQPSSSSQRRKSTNSSQNASKRSRATRNKPMDEVNKNLGQMTSSVAAMVPEFKSLINVLSYEKELTEMQANLKSVLDGMELTRQENFQATNILAQNHDLLRVFFTMSDEGKKNYVFDLLEYGI